MYLNAFYDLQKHTYSDTLIQAVHQKDEFRAFCDMVDRHHVLPGTKDVFIGDRGYCSYNNMAHVLDVSSGLLNSTPGYNHLSMTRQVAAQSLTDDCNPAFNVAKPDEKRIMKPNLPFPYLYW